MNEHLLLVTLGPVQEFIAQARRTRDLWYGSHLLSELGRAAARALVAGGAQLVFPALDQGDPELESCFAPVRRNGQPSLSIPNKLLAAVPSGVDPVELARAVRVQVSRHWRENIAATVKEDCKGLLAPHIDEVWAEQIDTLVEFLATWAPLNDYAEARRAVERAIAGRKNLRDFSPWRHTRGAVPKSSLDGARETVLRAPKERDQRLAQKYRIADGEQLDAVALVKRAGGEPDQFVPVVNIAIACWVELAGSTAAPELKDLRKACSETGISRVARGDLSSTALFPFDASVLLRNRWEAVFEEQRIEGDPQLWGRSNVGPLLQKMSEPYPYVACLVADGDHMGRALDAMRSGGRRAWRARWDKDPAGSLQRSMMHLEGFLSTRKVYEIASVLRRLPGDSLDPRWAKILAREVERAVSHVGEGSLSPGQVDLDLNDDAGHEKLRMRISAWVSRVLIARVLARSVPRQRNRSIEEVST